MAVSARGGRLFPKTQDPAATVWLFTVIPIAFGGLVLVAVASVSAALFALLHAGNLLTGQSLFATAFQLVYTFAFGILMYLTLRVTGNLIWPILLHATTDPSIFLSTLYPTQSAAAAVGDLGNPAVIVAGLILLIFIRGRATPSSRRDIFSSTPIRS